MKAPGNYSASICYNNFSNCLWGKPKLLISMISRFWDESRPPPTKKTTIFMSGDTTKLNKNKKSTKHFQNDYLSKETLEMSKETSHSFLFVYMYTHCFGPRIYIYISTPKLDSRLQPGQNRRTQTINRLIMRSTVLLVRACVAVVKNWQRRVEWRVQNTLLAATLLLILIPSTTCNEGGSVG